MKRKIPTILFTGGTMVILTSFVLMQEPQDPPKKQKKEKHISMVKVDDKGKKTSIDTVLEGDATFVWEGDTVGGKNLEWVSKTDFAMDSMHEFDYKMKSDGNGMIFIHKHGNDCEDFMMPPAPPVPDAPRMMMFDHGRKRNVIDLSDPGIISYDKKLRKDGTEKITIIRKQVSEDEPYDVMIDAPDPVIQIDEPVHSKTVKVIKEDDGTYKVIEDDKVINVKAGEGETKFISDDGKVIKIKEKKGSDEKQVEVEVQVDDEKK